MARRLDAALELLDRQLLDHHGQPAGGQGGAGRLIGRIPGAGDAAQ